MKNMLRWMPAYIICWCFLISVPAYGQEQYTGNGDTAVFVSCREDFYKAINCQIKEHQEIGYYDTYENALGADMEEVLDGYSYSHDIDNLPDSGSYLCRYLEHVELEVSHGNFSEDRNCRIKVDLTFKYGKEEVDEYLGKMQVLAQELKKESAFESVKAVHDYLIKQYDYDYNYQNYLDFEGYQNGTMVCQGYCMAAFLLLADMGIPVRIVTGASQDYQADPDHAWNVVNVDGKWYNMDVTWDDKGGWRPPDYTFFLKSDADFYRHTREGIYDYDKDMAIVSYQMPNRGGLLFLVLVVVAVAVVLFLCLRPRFSQRQDFLDSDTTF